MQFETIYRELENSTEIIRALVLGVSQEQSRVKPSPESWSILEVICHLYDEEREDFREHVDLILHRQEDPWHVIDPQGWVSLRHYNEQSSSEMQEKFFAERKRSLHWLSDLPNPNWDTIYTSEYGTTSAGEMLACWAAHDTLHIRQLVELRRHLLEIKTRPYSLEYAGEW